MSARITVSFDSNALLGLDDTNPVVYDLTDYQVCMLLQVILLLENRSLWQDMTDSEWHNLQDNIANVIGTISE